MIETHNKYRVTGLSIAVMDSTTVGLLTLPAELRLRIYDYLPDLSKDKQLYIAAGNALTPHICRTSKLLREETIPLFACNANFSISLAANPNSGNWLTNAMTVWLDGLGDTGLIKMSKLILSRHWELSKPTRNQNHVGFYLKLERDNSRKDRNQPGTYLPKWKTTVGTYPVANDMRGMRRESAELLKKIVAARLECGHAEEATINGGSGTSGPRSFTREDLELIIRAIDVIARHPFSTIELDQDHEGKQRRRNAFEKMEQELLLLAKGHDSAEQRKVLYPLDGEDVKLYSRR